MAVEPASLPPLVVGNTTSALTVAASLKNRSGRKRQ